MQIARDMIGVRKYLNSKNKIKPKQVISIRKKDDGPVFEKQNTLNNYDSDEHSDFIHKVVNQEEDAPTMHNPNIQQTPTNTL